MARFINSLLTLAAITLLVTASGCFSSPRSEAQGAVTVTDQLGRVVTFTSVPQRIISLAPSNTEILYALGLVDSVVGVTDYDNFPPEVKQKPSIGGFSTPNLEKIMALSPDLVVATSIHQKTVIPSLEQRGITVLALDSNQLIGILDAITLMGKVTGKSKEAAQLTDDMQAKIKAVTDKTDGLSQSQRPRVIYITWNNPLMTVGAGNIDDEIVVKAGGINIAHNLSGNAAISLESVIAANPEVIIAGVGMGTGGDQPLQFALNEPRLRDTDARQYNRVYAMDMNLAGRAGPRIAGVLEQFAEFIHPELFK